MMLANLTTLELVKAVEVIYGQRIRHELFSPTIMEGVLFNLLKKTIFRLLVNKNLPPVTATTQLVFFVGLHL
jgi:hypothetical protein